MVSLGVNHSCGELLNTLVELACPKKKLLF
jgi:hypothetical protein